MMKLFKGVRQSHVLVLHYLQGSGSVKDAGYMAHVVRSMLLLAGMVIGLTGLLFGFDLVLEALEECITIAFEFVQESLETLYRKQFKLELYQAQMATAYTVFFVFIGVGYYVFKRLSEVYQRFRLSWRAKIESVRNFLVGYMIKAMEIWRSMDGINRCFALIAFVAVAFPLVSIICIILGKIVAELV